MNNYIKNTHEIRKLLVQEYGEENAAKFKLVRNPYNKSLLSVTVGNGIEIETYNHIPKVGWLKI
jgi:hypothetical protein